MIRVAPPLAVREALETARICCCYSSLRSCPIYTSTEPFTSDSANSKHSDGVSHSVDLRAKEAAKQPVLARASSGNVAKRTFMAGTTVQVGPNGKKLEGHLSRGSQSALQSPRAAASAQLGNRKKLSVEFPRVLI
jgi:hypothetical protein